MVNHLVLARNTILTGKNCRHPKPSLLQNGQEANCAFSVPWPPNTTIGQAWGSKMACQLDDADFGRATLVESLPVCDGSAGLKHATLIL